MPAQTSVQIKVISNKIPQLPAALRRQVVDQVARSTFDVEARAKQVVAVKTGTLRRSIHSRLRAGRPARDLRAVGRLWSTRSNGHAPYGRSAVHAPGRRAGLAQVRRRAEAHPGGARLMSNFQGGHPQRVLVSQGAARPGLRQGQCWVSRICWEQVPWERLPYVRPVPSRRPDPRLSNPVAR